MDLIDPTLDVVFKMLLLRDESLLRSMIEAVLGLPAPLSSVTVLNPELPSHLPEHHGVVLDVRAQLASGEEVDIEMSTRSDESLPPRLLYYWARHFSGQLVRGDPYRVLLPTRGIVWTTRTFLPEVELFHETFRLTGARSAARFSEHLEIHVLDLSKLGKTRPDDEPRLLRWGRFFVLDDIRQARLLAAEDPTMSIALTKLEEISHDPEARRIAAERERDLLAQGHTIGAALRRGRKEGFELGKQEGIELGKQEGIELERRALLHSVLTLAEVLGVTLTPQQTSALDGEDATALRARLASLRHDRAWR